MEFSGNTYRPIDRERLLAGRPSPARDWNTRHFFVSHAPPSERCARTAASCGTRAPWSSSLPRASLRTLSCTLRTTGARWSESVYLTHAHQVALRTCAAALFAVRIRAPMWLRDRKSILGFSLLCLSLSSVPTKDDHTLIILLRPAQQQSLSRATDLGGARNGADGGRSSDAQSCGSGRGAGPEEAVEALLACAAGAAGAEHASATGTGARTRPAALPVHTTRQA
jgi:hypothetical protein